MYTFDLILDISQVEPEDIFGECEYLISYLNANGQIISEDYQLIARENELRIPVTCPEENSLNPRYYHKFIPGYFDKLHRITGKPVEIRPTGRALDFIYYEAPEEVTSYILYGESWTPIRCGDSCVAVPLYRLPFLEPAYNSYQPLNSWHSAYQTLQSLWTVYDAGEAYALAQMQEIDSPLTRQGLELRRQIEELTGMPTYYFLENRREWHESEEPGWKCPLTGKDWFIPGSTFNDFIGFRSEEARLVSGRSSLAKRDG
ncbi:DUF2310 family Zn-ribbon-containing protein [Larkinella soli]|uniref:DUF2310 family Zn-ribbon-containing protein n=1 Tax=Larkinella soli TaxID=1770527 RepID=UPI000FFBD91E|nr:DUF2310 family Zn-ribbon-containing protein [Larkinella soli]